MREPVERKDLERLDGVISNSIKRGKKSERKIKGYKMASLVLTMIMIFGVNISPTFAKVMGDLPLIGEPLMWLTLDKGLERAKENGYAQDIQKTIEVNGVKLTIDSAIADNKRLFVEATIEDFNRVLDDERIERRFADLTIFEITSRGDINHYSSIDTQDMKTSFEKVADGKYKLIKDISLSREKEVSQEILIAFRELRVIYKGEIGVKSLLGVKTNEIMDNAVRVKLDSKFLQEYEKTSKIKKVNMGGIDYSIEEISISPISTRLILKEIGYGEKMVKGKNKNTYYDHYDFDEEKDDLWLEDEHGNRYDILWSCIRTKNIGSKEGIKKQGYIELKFESAYYDNPKELSLCGEVFVANKEEKNISLNLRDKTMGIEDEGNILEIKEVIENEKGIFLTVEDIRDNHTAIKSYVESDDFGYACDEEGYKYSVGILPMKQGENISVYGLVFEGVNGYMFSIKKSGTHEGKKEEVDEIKIPVRGFYGEMIKGLDVKILK